MTQHIDRLNRVMDGALLGIAGLAVGIALIKAFEGFGQFEFDGHGKTTSEPEEDTASNGNTDWAALGRAMLNQKSIPSQTISDHLRCQYAGLYFIGRSKERLSPSEAESLAVHLQHFHNQLGRLGDAGDANIAAWYQTLGVSHPTRLSILLQDCPEVVELGVVPEFIAYAMGEDVDDDAVDWPGADDDLRDLRERTLIE